MKMAKASEADLELAMELCGASDSLTNRWYPTVPEKAESPAATEDGERLDLSSAEQCERVLRYLLQLAVRFSLMRVVFGCAVMLDPRNHCVDPAADTIELHPDAKAGQAAQHARPMSDWHEAMGAVLWWTFPVCEAPWCGKPTYDHWPGYHTHWTPLIVPITPVVTTETEAA